MATQTELLTNYSINDLAGQSMENDVQWAEIDHTPFPINCQAKLWVKSQVKDHCPSFLGLDFHVPSTYLDFRLIDKSKYFTLTEGTSIKCLLPSEM